MSELRRTHCTQVQAGRVVLCVWGDEGEAYEQSSVMMTLSPDEAQAMAGRLLHDAARARMLESERESRAWLEGKGDG